MFANLLTVATQVGILFVLIGVGYFCHRTRFLPEAVMKGFVDFLVRVVTPCLIVHAFQRPYEPAMLAGLGAGFVISTLVLALGMSLAGLVHTRNEARQRTLRFAVVFSNAGFMGIPLEQAILGSDGVFYGTTFVVMFNVACWTWGLRLMSAGSERLNVKTLLLNPGILGLAVGLPLFFAPFRLPPMLGEPVRMLSDLNTPLAMLVIGYYLGDARLRDVVRRPMAWFATALRLLVAPGAALAFLWGLTRLGVALDPNLTVAMVIAASAPVAALTTVFSVKFRGDVSVSVGLVAGTTLLSILTMPPVIAFALHLFGGAPFGGS